MSESLSLGDLGYPTADTVRRAAEYHAILTDLIAELREWHRPSCECHCECGARWEDGDCSSLDAVCRAEARLREVSGDE